jgi:hypothetical protein
MALLHENLLAVAEALLDLKNMGSAARRRAISTAYYATFRRIASLCAASLASDAEDFETVVRTLNHKQVLKDLKSERAKSLFRAAGTDAEVGALFEGLLNAREWADYSSAPTIIAGKARRDVKLTRADAAKYISDARAIISALDSLEVAARVKLAILLIIPPKR